MRSKRDSEIIQIKQGDRGEQKIEWKQNKLTSPTVAPNTIAHKNRPHTHQQNSHQLLHSFLGVGIACF